MLETTPIGALGVKCKECKHIIAPQEKALRCKCGLIKVEADGEVIIVRHTTASKHGVKPFEIDRKDVLAKADKESQSE